MATTQVAMVEELASLIKDNLHSKHLVLSTEEALIAALQQQCSLDDNDDDGRGQDDDAEDTIELQPTGAYHRLLLHRLADIYGFVHESVGEGDDRHLVLQRCSETAIPPVLVSDMLWKYDNCDNLASVVLTRNDADFRDSWKAEIVQEDVYVESSHLKPDADLKPVKHSVILPTASLKEREASYRAARERIFSVDDAKERNASSIKSRQIPIVAQRMIAHALGKNVHNLTEAAASREGRGKQQTNGPNIPTSSRNNFYPVSPDNREASYIQNSDSNTVARNSYQTTTSQKCRTVNRRAVSAESLKKEQTGAAKRMFAHALGLPAVQGSNGAGSKPK
ncbi:hypothetical protein EJB05_06594 [Eragrostis curvula]|uniref:R3H domain-containing protein n=1 Tax=Eragrostis curvula TaxID=38414 RepID=A0A5J9WFQ6_9POAL|nr:hypothetical protein EJB05_06594 [Eragrostis curvula]